MKDTARFKKFSTQLSPLLVEQIAPNGWVDSTKTRNVFSAAGIPSPVEDTDLIKSLEDNAIFLNAFLSQTSWTPLQLDACDTGSHYQQTSKVHKKNNKKT